MLAHPVAVPRTPLTTAVAGPLFSQRNPVGFGRPLLTVTADDLGYSSERDDGILRAFHDGVVRNASLLVNGESAPKAIRRAVSAGLCVGLHVNLTEGSPCAEHASIRSLLRPPDFKFFRGKFGLRESVSRGEIALSDVSVEVAAQLARFRALHPAGSNPPYIDGHQHVHVLPLIVLALCPLISAHNIQVVRIPALCEAEDLSELAPVRRSFYDSINADCEAARIAFAAAGAASTDEFIGYGARGGSQGTERVLGALSRLCSAASDLSSRRAHVVEWMTHPGFRTLPPPRPTDTGGAGCGEGPDDFSQSAEREEELAVLCDAALKAGLESMGLRPVSLDEARAELASAHF
jgi:predicted glycoside hydrolase/deacetylase ChbG (UPF0249 family)